MFNIIDDDLKWNIRFLEDNPNFLLETNKYIIKDDKIIILNCLNITEKCMISMYQCATKNNELLYNDFEDEKICDYCDIRDSNCYIYYNDMKLYMCNYCLEQYLYIETNIVKITDNIFSIRNHSDINMKFDYLNIFSKMDHLDTNTDIKFDYINIIDDYNCIIYTRSIFTINDFSYKTLSKYQIDYDICHRCNYGGIRNLYDHYIKSSNDTDSEDSDDSYYENQNYICQQCLNYSLQYVINRYLYRYIIINNMFVEVNDVGKLISYEFIDLIL